MSKVGVVVPCLNQFKMLCEALQSIRTGRDWQPFIIPNWRINQSVSWAWNNGIEQAIGARCDHIAVINDDVLFSPTTIDQLCEFLDTHPDCIMVSGCNKREELTDPYDIFNYTTDEEAVSDNPDFSCFMVRPNFFELVGRFDENYKPAYFEDNDMHYRVKLAGFKAQATTRAPFIHFGSKTQNSVPDGVTPSPVFENNRQYFRDKWGGWPGYEAFTQPYNNKGLTIKDWKPLP